MAGSLAKLGLKELFAVEEWPAVNAVRELATRVKKAADGIAPCSDAPAKPFVFSGLKQYALLAELTCRQHCCALQVSPTLHSRPLQCGPQLGGAVEAGAGRHTP